MNAPLGILSTLLFLRYLHTYKELLTEEKVQMLSRLCTWESWKSSKWSQKCTQNCIKNYSLICVWIFPVFKIVFKIDFEIITKIVPKNVPKFSPKLFDLYLVCRYNVHFIYFRYKELFTEGKVQKALKCCQDYLGKLEELKITFPHRNYEVAAIALCSCLWALSTRKNTNS